MKFFALAKKYCLLSLILSLISISLFAQDGFSISPKNFEVHYLNTDISDPYHSFTLKALMSNNSQDTLQIRWTKILASDCVEAWELPIADLNQGHFPYVSTNPNPVQLLPSDSNKIFNLIVRPKTIAGCCELKVVFSDYNNESIVFDTINYSIGINEESCLTTTSLVNSNFETQAIRIHPNPSYAHFYIESDLIFDQILIYDFKASIVKRIEAPSKNAMDISSLVSGIYLVLFLNENQVIGSSKLAKQ